MSADYKGAVLAVEGVTTQDGRRIVPGGLSWAQEPLPVLSMGRSAVGWVTNLRRVAGEILGDVHLESRPAVDGLAVDLDDVEIGVGDGTLMEVGDGTLMEFTQGRIRAVSLVQFPAWGLRLPE